MLRDIIQLHAAKGVDFPGTFEQLGMAENVFREHKACLPLVATCAALEQVL